MIVDLVHRDWASCQISTMGEEFCTLRHNSQHRFVLWLSRNKLVLVRLQLIWLKQSGEAMPHVIDTLIGFAARGTPETLHKAVALRDMQHTIDGRSGNQFSSHSHVLILFPPFSSPIRDATSTQTLVPRLSGNPLSQRSHVLLRL